MKFQKITEQIKRQKMEASAKAHFKQDQNGSNRYITGQFPLSVAEHALREYSQCLDLDDRIFRPEKISWRAKEVMYGALHLFSYFRLNHPSHPGRIDESIASLDLKKVTKEFEESPLLDYINTLMEVVYSTIIPWTDEKNHAIFSILVRERDNVWRNMRKGVDCSDTTFRDLDYRRKYATDRALEHLPKMLVHFGHRVEKRPEVGSEVSEKLTELLF